MLSPHQYNTANNVSSYLSQINPNFVIRSEIATSGAGKEIPKSTRQLMLIVSMKRMCSFSANFLTIYQSIIHHTMAFHFIFHHVLNLKCNINYIHCHNEMCLYNVVFRKSRKCQHFLVPLRRHSSFQLQA